MEYFTDNVILYSRTPDRDFRCFYPCEIFLSISHTHTSPRKRYRNEQPHAGRTSIRDAIVMLNDVTMSHHSVFRIFWKPFSVFFSNINEVLSGEQDKESIIVARMG